MLIGIPTICWYIMPSNCTYIFSMRKVKAAHNSVQVQRAYESYISPQLFDDIRRVFYGPKIIHITIAKDSFTVLYNMIFDCCESGCYMLR